MLRTRLMLGLVCLLGHRHGDGALLDQPVQRSRARRSSGSAGTTTRPDAIIQTMKRSGAAMTSALLTRAVGDSARKATGPSSRRRATTSRSCARFGKKQAAFHHQDRMKKSASINLADAFNTFTSHAQRFFLQPQQPVSCDLACRRPQAGPGSGAGSSTSSISYQPHDQDGQTRGGKNTSRRHHLGGANACCLMMAVASVATLMAYFGLSRGLLNAAQVADRVDQTGRRRQP